MRWFVVAFSLVSCQRSSHESACDELGQYSPPGIKLAEDEQRCREILVFASHTKDIYGFEFQEWFERVFAQRSGLILDTIDSLTKRDAHVSSIAYFPPIVPCGGLVLDDASWSVASIKDLLPRKPDKMFVSLAVEVAADQATIRVRQDFDCDNDFAVTTMSGRITQGLPALNGGWQPLNTSAAELDE